MLTTQESTAHRVLIIGGGFAGIECARRLNKKSLGSITVTLISNKTYFEYYPALYRIVTGESPLEACIPLSSILRGNKISIVQDTVTAVDLTQKKATGKDGAIYDFDSLVIALGSEINYFDIPGLDSLSFGFKSAGEAIRLKQHLHDLFVAHTHPSKDELVSHFHVVVVGGGPSGVELVGNLHSFLTDLAKKHNTDPSLITIDLIEASSRLAKALPESASVKILKRIRSLGANVFLNRTVVKEEIEEVYLKDMAMQSKTVIWAAGTRLNPLYKEIKGLEFAPNGRVVVDGFLSPAGFPGVYVVGDGAATPYSGLAQTAILDGAYVSGLITRKVQGKPPVPYMPRKNAFSIPIGRNWGLFVWGPFEMSGVVASWLRYVIDIKYFLQLLSIKDVIGLYKEGKKYAKMPDTCETPTQIESTETKKEENSNSPVEAPEHKNL